MPVKDKGGQAIKTALEMLLVVLLFLVATWGSYRLNGSPKMGIDDANIFFSYAENLATNHGIFYGHNSERVEGFTSFLWMVGCALMFKLRLGETGVLMLSFVLLCVVQIMFLSIIRRSAVSHGQKSWPYECAYLLLILSNPAYVTWMTITLMDTCLWGFIVAWLTYFAVFPPITRRDLILTILFVVLSLFARPESIVLTPVMIGLIWLRAKSTDQPHQAKFIFGLLCAFGVAVTFITVIRIYYFGFPFPNTYYAKVSPSLTYNLTRGVVYLRDFVSRGAIIGALVFVTMIGAASSIGGIFDRMLGRPHIATTWRHPIDPYEIAVLVATLLLIIPVLTGGDHFGLFRFYQPAYPVMCMAVVLLMSKKGVVKGDATWHALMDRTRQSPVRLMATLVICVCWLFSFAYSTSWISMCIFGSPISHEFRIATNGITSGEQMKDLFDELPSFPSVGVITAGGIARTYPGQIVDLMGLNNRRIAHFKGERKGFKNHAAFEKEAFFLVEPDILLASPPKPPEEKNFGSKVLKGLFEDTNFIKNWRFGILTLRRAPERRLEAFFANTFLRSLGAFPGYEFRETMRWSNKWVEANITSTLE